MFFLTYLYYKVLAVLIRALASRGRHPISNPDDVVYIQSREAARTIKAHVYRSASAPSPTPILINFHGSGFIIPMHGSDDEFCRQVSREAGYTVLDIQYRLAPENPFPAALHDAEDAVNWVLQRPEKFDTSRLAISGFSAGGNLALALSSSVFPRGTFRSLLALYPPVDLYTEPGLKTPPDPAGKPLPAALARVFDRCYIPASYDARDPRISPLYAQPDRFPDRILLVTAACDSLAGEAEALAAKIGKEPEREISVHQMQGCNHAFDKNAPEGSTSANAKDKSYAMAVAMLSRS